MNYGVAAMTHRRRLPGRVDDAIRESRWAGLAVRVGAGTGIWSLRCTRTRRLADSRSHYGACGRVVVLRLDGAAGVLEGLG